MMIRVDQGKGSRSRNLTLQPGAAGDAAGVLALAQAE